MPKSHIETHLSPTSKIRNFGFWQISGGGKSGGQNRWAAHFWSFFQNICQLCGGATRHKKIENQK